MKVMCTACKCDPCDCGWGNYYGTTEKGNSDRIHISSKLWWEYDGGDFEPTLHPSWPFNNDSVEYYEELYREGGSPRTYMGKMVLDFKIGDPVRYFPHCNLAHDEGVWMIKDIVNKSSIDSSWYDYEITNGSNTAFVRQEELFKLE